MGNADKTVLVTGATGRQGGAVARHMLAKGWRLRALTRNPNSYAAKQLTGAGVELVKGDLDDPASLERAARGVYGKLLAKEKEFSRLRDELWQLRRNLPWEKVEKEYVFESPSGKEV